MSANIIRTEGNYAPCLKFLLCARKLSPVIINLAIQDLAERSCLFDAMNITLTKK